MSEIAPLDYERWAVLVSPLLAPGAAYVEAKQPPRHAEQLGPVSAALNRPGSRAGEGLNGSDSRPMELGPKTLERDPEHPLNGPHPTDLNWFFQLPSGVRDSMQNQPALDPQKVTERYEFPEKPRGATVRLSG
ncbi:MAG: hypothetical protein ACE5GT_00545 [Rhodospirillales bacterium]